LCQSNEPAIGDDQLDSDSDAEAAKETLHDDGIVSVDGSGNAKPKIQKRRKKTKTKTKRKASDSESDSDGDGCGGGGVSSVKDLIVGGNDASDDEHLLEGATDLVELPYAICQAEKWYAARCSHYAHKKCIAVLEEQMANGTSNDVVTGDVTCAGDDACGAAGAGGTGGAANIKLDAHDGDGTIAGERSVKVEGALKAKDDAADGASCVALPAFDCPACEQLRQVRLCYPHVCKKMCVCVYVFRGDLDLRP
jgi:hypothetical protein